MSAEVSSAVTYSFLLLGEVIHVSVRTVVNKGFNKNDDVFCIFPLAQW